MGASLGTIKGQVHCWGKGVVHKDSGRGSLSVHTDTMHHSISSLTMQKHDLCFLFCVQEAEAFKLQMGDFAVLEEVAADVATTKLAWDRQVLCCVMRASAALDTLLIHNHTMSQLMMRWSGC